MKESAHFIFKLMPQQLTLTGLIRLYVIRPSTYFLVVSFGYKAVLLLFGIFLAFQVKDVEKNFNESKLLGLCIYNCSFLTVVALPVLLVIQKNNPDAYTAFLVVAINYVAITTLAILTGSKLYVIYYHLEEEAANSTKVKSELDMESDIPRNNSGRKSVEDEPWNLQRFDDTLNRHIARLRMVSQNQGEQQALASLSLERALARLRKDDGQRHSPNSPSGSSNGVELRPDRGTSGGDRVLSFANTEAPK